MVYVSSGYYDPSDCVVECERTHKDFRLAFYAYHAGTYDILKVGGWMLNPQYVGHTMSRDVAEIFYSTKNFYLDVCDVEDFLLCDRKQAGLKPCNYIRHNISIMVRTDGEEERTWWYAEDEIAFLNNIHKQLSFLTLITHKSEVSINLRLLTSRSYRGTRSPQDRELYNILESVRTPIYDLIHSGFNISVILAYICHGREEDVIKGHWNYFSMSKANWEAEKCRRDADWLPSMEFIMDEDLEDVGGHTKRAPERFYIAS